MTPEQLEEAIEEAKSHASPKRVLISRRSRGWPARRLPIFAEGSPSWRDALSPRRSIDEVRHDRVQPQFSTARRALVVDALLSSGVQVSRAMAGARQAGATHTPAVTLFADASALRRCRTAVKDEVFALREI